MAEPDSPVPAPGAAAKRSNRRPPPTLVVLVLVLVAAAIFGYREVRQRAAFVYEEDARIQADMITVSSRVAGWVTRLAIREGDRVDSGAVLATIDARESRVAAEELTAQLEAVAADKMRLRAEQELARAQTESRLQTMRSGLAAADVAVSSLGPQLKLARRDVERNRRLSERGMTSQSLRDQSESQLERLGRELRIATANRQGAKAKVEEAQAERARVEVLARQIEVLQKRENEIAARIRRQALDLDDRTIRSPVKGVVDRTFVEAGEYVSPGQRLLLMHDPQRIRIEANIKETELRRLAPGQKVYVHVDAYPEETFEGRLERIGNAATSAFALLPSPNPSGNFTKVTQRVPVRISIAQRDGRLRPGTMVEIRIATGG